MTIGAALVNALRGKPCRVFSSELYEAVAGQRVELASVGASLDLDELYRDPLSA